MRRLVEVLCGLLAALALLAVMLLTLVDVTGRKLASASVPGSLEVTELLMVVVIFAALPLVSLRGEHVVFDSLDPLIPRPLRRLQRLVVELFCSATLFGVAWLMWGKANDMLQYGDTTAQLKIAQGPFVHAMAVLCAVTALVHLLLIFESARHQRSGIDAAPGGA